MIRLALILCACEVPDYSVHAPSFGDDCGRVPIATYTADADSCTKLEDANGRTLFRLATSESCGGPPCVVLQPGETGHALELVKPGLAAEWTVKLGACDELPQCCGEYLGSYQCW